jgi:hypothetical protein
VKSDEMTQTPNNYTRIDEMTQTSLFGDSVFPEKQPRKHNHCMMRETTPPSSGGKSASKEDPMVKKFQSWEELGIVDHYTLKNLKSGVSIVWIKIQINELADSE